MTNEEMQKTMEFILNHQAQFAADIGAIKDTIGDITNAVSGLATAVVNRFEAVDEKIADLNDKMSALVDAQIRSEEKVNRLAGDLNEKMSALVDAQIRTEEGLNRTNEVVKKTNEDLRNLIAVVDRHLGEGRNGGNGR